MAHPQMYDEDDPVYVRVRELSLALPGAGEKFGHGRPMFYTVKVFAYYGGSVKVDGSYVRHEQAILFVPPPRTAKGSSTTRGCFDLRTSARSGGSGSTSGSTWTGRKGRSSSTRRTG